MIALTKQQMRDKWDATPEDVRMVLFAPKNTDTLWKIIGEQKIPDRLGYTMAKLVGWGLLGLLPISGVAKEIREIPGIDAQAAQSAGQEIEKQIFAPLKDELAALSDILPKEKRRTPDGAFVKIGAVRVAPPAANPAVPATKNAPSAPAASVFPPQSKMPAAAPGAPTKAQPPIPSGPVMLHKETDFAPINKPPANATTRERFASVFGAKKPSAPPPPPSARVEMGDMKMGVATRAVQTPASPNAKPETPRIVHYGELKSILNAPTAPIPPQELGRVSPVSFGSLTERAAPQAPKATRDIVGAPTMRNATPLQAPATNPTQAPASPAKPPVFRAASNTSDIIRPSTPIRTQNYSETAPVPPPAQHPGVKGVPPPPPER